MMPAKSKHITDLLPLLLFVVLTISVLTLLLTGAESYAQLTARDYNTKVVRTAAQYVATKLHQSEQNSTQILPFGDGDALVIHERLADMDFTTRIYCHDGWLYELFTFADEEVSPEDGEKIVELAELSLFAEEGVLRVRLTGRAGDERELWLALGGKERAS